MKRRKVDSLDATCNMNGAASTLANQLVAHCDIDLRLLEQMHRRELLLEVEQPILHLLVAPRCKARRVSWAFQVALSDHVAKRRTKVLSSISPTSNERPNNWFHFD